MNSPEMAGLGDAGQDDAGLGEAGQGAVLVFTRGTGFDMRSQGRKRAIRRHVQGVTGARRSRKRIRDRVQSRDSADGHEDGGRPAADAGSGPVRRAPGLPMTAPSHADGGPWRTPEKRGVFSRMWAWITGERAPSGADAAAPAPADDPVRRILAMPRGVPRLDAFSDVLDTLTPGTPGHRTVTIAFYRQLTQMVEDARLDFTLVKNRVRRCAQALENTGELARAASLYQRVGDAAAAARLFTAAGDIDGLSGLDGQDHVENDAAFLGRLAYQRYQAFFDVGLRTEAIDALDVAIAKCPSMQAWQDVRTALSARLFKAGRIALKQAGTEVRVRFERRMVLGRDTDAALRVQSPVVSRQHAAIERQGEAWMLVDLASKTGTTLDGAAVTAPQALGAAGALGLGGVSLRYVATAACVLLWSENAPEQFSVAALPGASAQIELPGGRVLGPFAQDARGAVTAEPAPHVTLNGQAVDAATMLLRGDALEVHGQTWALAAL